MGLISKQDHHFKNNHFSMGRNMRTNLAKVQSRTILDLKLQ